MVHELRLELEVSAGTSSASTGALTSDAGMAAGTGEPRAATGTGAGTGSEDSTVESGNDAVEVPGPRVVAPSVVAEVERSSQGTAGSGPVGGGPGICGGGDLVPLEPTLVRSAPERAQGDELRKGEHLGNGDGEGEGDGDGELSITRSSGLGGVRFVAGLVGVTTRGIERDARGRCCDEGTNASDGGEEDGEAAEDRDVGS